MNKRDGKENGGGKERRRRGVVEGRERKRE